MLVGVRGGGECAGVCVRGGGECTGECEGWRESAGGLECV